MKTSGSSTSNSGSHGQQQQPPSHQHQHHQSSLLLWMLLDGIGLGLIAGCTVLEGLDLWNDFFAEHYASNHGSMAFWVSGRSCQVIGLLFLMAHAASFQVLPPVETAGMILLTVGPILNICACSLFSTSISDGGVSSDPNFLFNRQWLLTELVELIGISTLDLSLIDTEHWLVLTAEVVGFTILGCAAILDFDFSASQTGVIPEVSLRLDIIHLSDVFGLFCLTCVSIKQYQIKESKHHSLDNKQQQQQQQQQQQHESHESHKKRESVTRDKQHDEK